MARVKARSPLEGELSDAANALRSSCRTEGARRRSAGEENPHPSPSPRKRGLAADRPLKGGGKNAHGDSCAFSLPPAADGLPDMRAYSP